MGGTEEGSSGGFCSQTGGEQDVWVGYRKMEGWRDGWSSGWSLRPTWWEGRRGGQTYQQSEGWVGKLADGRRRGGGMEGQMEAQLDVKDRCPGNRWPNE